MKRFFVILLCLCALVACTGNPPAWWNPQNRYGTAGETSAVNSVRPVKKTVVKDETIDVADTSYEEEILAPLPEETAPTSVAGQPDSLPVPSVLE